MRWMVLGVVLGACSLLLGPQPLEGDAHMRSYLQGGTWENRDHEGDTWSFAEDGSFQAKGEVKRFFSDAPEGATAVSGSWTADAQLLSVTAVKAGEGQGLGDREFALGWVDGKLHIDIGGVRHSRW